MVNLSEESKQTAGNLLSVLNSNSPDDSIGANPSTYDLLNAIFKIMVKKEEYKNLQDQLDDDQNDQRHFKRQQRQDELLEALGKKPGVPMKESQKYDPKKLDLKKYLKKIKVKDVKIPEKVNKPATASATEGFSLGKIAKVGAAAAAVGVIGAGVLSGKGALASVIAGGESAGDPTAYNKRVGDKYRSGKGKTIHGKALTEMTVGEISQLQASKELFAVGKYQMVPDTMKDALAAGAVNVNEVFTEGTQDRLFDYLLTRKKSAKDYITGKNDSLEDALIALSREWAAVGVPKDMKGHHRWVKKGESYYAGDGHNKAGISPEIVANALQKDRNDFAATKIEQQQNVGVVAMNLDQTSRDNIITSQDVTTATPNSTISNQYNVAVKESSPQRGTGKIDDRPWIERKSNR